MAGRKGREIEFKRWPGYKGAYVRAVDRMVAERAKRGRQDGMNAWTSGIDTFNWWMEYDILPGQMSMEDFMEEDDG